MRGASQPPFRSGLSRRAPPRPARGPGSAVRRRGGGCRGALPAGGPDRRAGPHRDPPPHRTRRACTVHIPRARARTRIRRADGHHAESRHLRHRGDAARASRALQDARRRDPRGRRRRTPPWRVSQRDPARTFDAFWVDIGPSDVGYWAMVVPPGTRVWPFGRILRLIAMQHNERILVSYFLELQVRAASGR